MNLYHRRSQRSTSRKMNAFLYKWNVFLREWLCKLSGIHYLVASIQYIRTRLKEGWGARKLHPIREDGMEQKRITQKPDQNVTDNPDFKQNSGVWNLEKTTLFPYECIQVIILKLIMFAEKPLEMGESYLINLNKGWNFQRIISYITAAICFQYLPQSKRE